MTFRVRCGSAQTLARAVVAIASACIGKNDVVSVSRYREQHTMHPIGTTPTVASEFGFGPELDPVWTLLESGDGVGRL